jgi:DNA (cytosine-5)-methyltransferase 1
VAEPTFGSLFAGIGGIDLGLERAGWIPRWSVEWEPFPGEILAHRWPDVARYQDVTKIDPGELEYVELIAGGFPCQPISQAGQRRAQDDARWLWPDFLRIVRGVGPRFVVVENVRNLLRVAGGSAMGEVLGGLADAGYDAEWDLLSARDVGAPHRRERVFLRAERIREPGGDRPEQ